MSRKEKTKNAAEATAPAKGIDFAAASKRLEVARTTPMPVAAKGAIDFAADAGSGLEGTGAESFAIPMLMILQQQSPQVVKASGKFIPGAEAGMFYESIGDILTDGNQGIQIIFCAYRRVYLRFDKDDKYRGELAPEAVSRGQMAGQYVDVKGKLYVPGADGKVDVDECDILQDCRNHYILVVDPKTGDWRQALLSCRSTQIKKSRMLMTALASIKVKTEGGAVMPPTYASIVRATTVPESNDDGDWFGWQFKLEGFVESKELYNAAKKFHQSITAGLVRVDVPEDALKDGAKTGF